MGNRRNTGLNRHRNRVPSSDRVAWERWRPTKIQLSKASVTASIGAFSEQTKRSDAEHPVKLMQSDVLARSGAMPKQDKRKPRMKAYELPRLAVGDVLLVGKFKNRKATITGFSSDENNQPVAQTDKGEHKIFKPRIAKLMPAKQQAKDRLKSLALRDKSRDRGRRP